MREEDAVKKWCPVTRMVAVNEDNLVLNSASFNKCSKEDGTGSFAPSGSYCIASDCMMWRTRIIGGVEMTEDGERECLKEIGYCGLAGKE